MRKFGKIAVFGLSLLAGGVAVNAQRASTSASARAAASTETVMRVPTEAQCQQKMDYCFNEFCWGGLVGERSRGTNICYQKGIPQIVDGVNECLKLRDAIENVSYSRTCQRWAYNYIASLKGRMPTMDAIHAQGTGECQRASRHLDAARRCYNIMMAHDGSIDPGLRARLDMACGPLGGGNDDMVERFLTAGDYGKANIGAQEDMLRTGQMTAKQSNWRQLVEAVLASYIDIAQSKCGQEDYRITRVNEYAPDDRMNLAMLREIAAAEAQGREMGNRAVNNLFRESDCLNTPLPHGGKQWYYAFGQSPDCRIICIDGWRVGKDSATCEVDEELFKQRAGIGGFEGPYYGFNVHGDYRAIIRQSWDFQGVPVEVGEVPETGNFGTCDKSIAPSRTFAMSKDGICGLFKRPDGTCRSYYRVELNAPTRVRAQTVGQCSRGHNRFCIGNPANTGPEHFCFGRAAGHLGSVEFWAQVSVADIVRELKYTGAHNNLIEFDYTKGTLSGWVAQVCGCRVGGGGGGGARTTTATPAPSVDATTPPATQPGATARRSDTRFANCNAFWQQSTAAFRFVVEGKAAGGLMGFLNRAEWRVYIAGTDPKNPANTIDVAKYFTPKTGVEYDCRRGRPNESFRCMGGGNTWSMNKKEACQINSLIHGPNLLIGI
ncbi:MAG: hypothetical protein FWD15_01670 [Alphaproteobacteria bacterium]|nr:hypothetical protein [Alphaproteobacteria bacterium]